VHASKNNPQRVGVRPRPRRTFKKGSKATRYVTSWDTIFAIIFKQVRPRQQRSVVRTIDY